MYETEGSVWHSLIYGISTYAKHQVRTWYQGMREIAVVKVAARHQTELHVWLEVDAWQQGSNSELVNTHKQSLLKTAGGHGCLAHKLQQQSTAAKSSTTLYVVCERSTTLKTSVVGWQTW